ncbi:MAG TPA: DEAD/DEAH box helicase [Sphaerochaeta sp.]|nr:DEAD/DEAH box helicase [Sphaerochaeta sp.]
MKLELYPWQEACLEAWKQNQSRGIIQVVTGGGKTILALAAANRLQERVEGEIQVKIIVPKQFMVAQWTASLLDHKETFGVEKEEIGNYSGLNKDDPSKRYMIYVVNSARYKLSIHIAENLKKGKPVLIIADECHHYASAENRKIFDFMSLLDKKKNQQYFSLGLSATPQTEGFNSVLVPSLGPLFYSYGFSEAIKAKVINTCVLFNLGLYLNDEEAAEYDDITDKITTIMKKLIKVYPAIKAVPQGQFLPTLRMLAKDPESKAGSFALKLIFLFFKRKEIVYEAEARVSSAIALVARLGNKAKIIIFGERISQTDLLFLALDKEYPNRVARYHSEMGEVARKHAIDRYRDGEVRILVSCKALDEGFDIPAADVGIVLSSNSVQRQRIQRLGRILRRSSDKGISSLFYFYMEYTIEDSGLLDNGIEGVDEFMLNYSADNDNFTNASYDPYAQEVLDKLTNRGQTDLLATTKHFLDLGRVRTDWLESEELLEEKIKEARGTEETNYWLCMREVARAKKKLDSYLFSNKTR